MKNENITLIFNIFLFLLFFHIILSEDTYTITLKVKTEGEVLIINNTYLEQLSDIIVGFDTSQVLCSYGEKKIYKNIIISAAEYEFFIIYDENNTPNLDCNLNDYGFFQSEITKIKNYCGNCGSNCLTCSNTNTCSKCLEGFSLKNYKECVIIKDKISFDKFDKVEDFIRHEKSCENEDNKMQLFSFKYTYVITKGENLAIESAEYKNLIFANNEDERYPLKCII